MDSALQDQHNVPLWFEPHLQMAQRGVRRCVLCGGFLPNGVDPEEIRKEEEKRRQAAAAAKEGKKGPAPAGGAAAGGFDDDDDDDD